MAFGHLSTKKSVTLAKKVCHFSKKVCHFSQKKCITLAKKKYVTGPSENKVQLYDMAPWRKTNEGQTSGF